MAADFSIPVLICTLIGALYLSLLISICLVLLRPAAKERNTSLIWIAGYLTAWAVLRILFYASIFLLFTTLNVVELYESYAVFGALAVLPITAANLRHFAMIQNFNTEITRRRVQTALECLVVVAGAIGVIAAWVIARRQMYYSSTQIPETARVVLHIADWALLLLSAVPLLTFINKRPDIGAGVVVTVMVQALLQCGEMAYSVSRDLNIRIDSFIDEIFYDLFLLMLSEVIIVIIFLARRRGFLFVLHGQAAKDETHIQLEELPSGQSEWK